ncbi:MAG: hypothetical protein DRP47_11955 [Candidatus Zixiibacteriota bacterium]|nr:MAG: hypothetical protein DRP47_11955 [candidate division Zixibacteria bacterium]
MNTLALTINPATTSESIIQLASGKSLAIVSGTITPTGLPNTTIYVDGVAGSTVTADYHRIVITFDDVACTDVQIGYDGNSYFDGFIGNVQLWNAAFDADDVEYDYLNCYQNLTADNRPGTSLTSANLKGHWPLIAGSGDVAYDYSGNGHHGTLTNFPTDDSQWSNASALDSPLAIQTALCEWGMGSNILPYSDMLDSSWAFQHASRSENGTRLDGRTAILLTEDDSTGQHRLRLLSTDFVAGTNTLRARVKKAGTKDYCDFALYNSTDGTVAKARLTFSTGLLSNTTGDVNVETLSDGWFQVSISGIATVDGTFVSGIGDNQSVPGINGPSIWIDGIQGNNGDIGAATITYAQGCTNTLVPIRSWETAGQFKRDYSELNFNGRSYADCGNGADVNPSTALTVEFVLAGKDLSGARSQYIMRKESIYQVKIDSETPKLLSQVYLKGGETKALVLGTLIDTDPHHVVFTYDASSKTIRGYMDGVFVVSSTFTAGSLGYNLGVDSHALCLAGYSLTSPSLTSQLPLFKMWIDAEAQAIIDDDLDAWVAKRYAKAAAKYGL